MRIIVMGDLHYSLMENGTTEMLEARDKVYADMLEHFVGLDAEFHISIGDLVHEGLPEEFNYVLNRIDSSERSFIHVLGNHDTYALPKSDVVAITRQQRYHAIEGEEAMLIFLDTTKEMNRDDWGGEMDAKQLEWLQAQLEKSGNKPVLVFAHHPIYGTTARSTEEKMSIDPQMDMLDVLNRKKGHGFYFCGHNHMNSIVKKDGWHYIQTAACLDVPAFRRVELNEQGVQIDLVAVDKADLADYIALFNTEVTGLTPVLEAWGEDADKSLRVLF
ncbi:metallophosphoesterase family protein [Paenibacillus rigui]|uniref:Metallophosphoesterase n=1 Tax=Paenibacillus rigui TaxID=554312 RepID=A0A229UI39_9BACL|nr:metallophosphoesterase [Paenibacillus rigui]OXM82579.1 metallophosphoesterase [Paenibacillus rigui]